MTNERADMYLCDQHHLQQQEHAGPAQGAVQPPGVERVQVRHLGTNKHMGTESTTEGLKARTIASRPIRFQQSDWSRSDRASLSPVHSTFCI